jgi:hypothetical protein
MSLLPPSIDPPSLLITKANNPRPRFSSSGLYPANPALIYPQKAICILLHMSHLTHLHPSPSVNWEVFRAVKDRSLTALTALNAFKRPFCFTDVQHRIFPHPF